MFTFGSDVEVFIRRMPQNSLEAGRLVAAAEFLRWPKSNPLAISGCKMHYDNVALEVATPVVHSPPSLSALTHHISNCLRDNIPQGMEVLPLASLDVEEYGLPFEVFMNPEMGCLEFGCDPDYSAYTGTLNVMPSNAAQSGFRTCGGHIHIGMEQDNRFDPENKEHCMALAKACDLFILTPLILNKCFDFDRMKLYGKPGTYRPKPYGIEYRTPCNTWFLKFWTGGLARMSHLKQISLDVPCRLWELFLSNEVNQVMDGFNNVVLRHNTYDPKMWVMYQEFAATLANSNIGGDLSGAWFLSHQWHEAIAS